RDPDGVLVLYKFNGKGERDYTILPLGDGSEIYGFGYNDLGYDTFDPTLHFDGLDRITWTTNDVVSDHGADVLRMRRFVWSENGSATSNLVSTTETSVDGLSTWQTVFRDASTPVVSKSQMIYAGSGSRYLTNTAPDGSYVVSVFSYDRLASTTRYSSSGGQIFQTIFGYDAHARQNTMTDARNGTT